MDALLDVGPRDISHLVHVAARLFDRVLPARRESIKRVNGAPRVTVGKVHEARAAQARQLGSLGGTASHSGGGSAVSQSW